MEKFIHSLRDAKGDAKGAVNGSSLGLGSQTLGELRTEQERYERGSWPYY